MLFFWLGKRGCLFIAKENLQSPEVNPLVGEPTTKIHTTHLSYMLGPLLQALHIAPPWLPHQGADRRLESFAG